MAHYETVLSIARPTATTFDFVSDFRNAAHWDPRTYRVEKTPEGPIGVGTRFMLTGGMMKEEVVRRLRVPVSWAGMPLPYDVVDFDPPHGFVLEGESRLFRYRDVLEFTSRSGGTDLRYEAQLEFRGPFRVAEPLLTKLFQRIGDDATRELAATVEART